VEGKESDLADAAFTTDPAEQADDDPPRVHAAHTSAPRTQHAYRCPLPAKSSPLAPAHDLPIVDECHVEARLGGQDDDGLGLSPAAGPPEGRRSGEAVAGGLAHPRGYVIMVRLGRAKAAPKTLVPRANYFRFLAARLFSAAAGGGFASPNKITMRTRLPVSGLIMLKRIEPRSCLALYSATGQETSARRRWPRQIGRCAIYRVALGMVKGYEFKKDHYLIITR